MEEKCIEELERKSKMEIIPNVKWKIKIKVQLQMEIKSNQKMKIQFENENKKSIWKLDRKVRKESQS